MDPPGGTVPRSTTIQQQEQNKIRHNPRTRTPPPLQSSASSKIIMPSSCSGNNIEPPSSAAAARVSSSLNRAENTNRISSRPGEEIGCTATSSSFHSYHHDEEQQSQSSSLLLQLPRLITVTVPKRIDQPAGLTLSSSSLESMSRTTSNSNSTPSRSKSREESSRKLGEISSRKDDGSMPKSSRSSQQRRNSALNNNNGVIISAISPQSPFHPENLTTTNRDNHNINEVLQTGDEILLINNHRVKNPQWGAQMIKDTTCGSLTIVASRGLHDGTFKRKEYNGMAYHLAKFDNTHHNQEGDTNCGLEFQSRGALTRISSIHDQSPFRKAGCKVGDVLLAIDGSVVKSVAGANKLLNTMTSHNSNGQGGDNSDGINDDDDDRVVALLVYSFWDMRRTVLQEKLHLESAAIPTSSSYNGDTELQLWQASYPYEEQATNQNSQQDKEYVILGIPSTSITFQLDFDTDGICSCIEPFKAMTSLLKLDTKTDSDSDNGEQGSNCSDNEARAALELLYRKHVSPAIDALNCHTWRGVRLLVGALDAAADDDDVTAANNIDATAVKKGEKESMERKAGTKSPPPPAVVEFLVESPKEHKRVAATPTTTKKEISHSPKQEPIRDPASSSICSITDKSSSHNEEHQRRQQQRKDSKKKSNQPRSRNSPLPPQDDVDIFQEQLGKVQLVNPASRDNNSSRQLQRVYSTNKIAMSNVVQTCENEISNNDPPEAMNPQQNRKLYNSSKNNNNKPQIRRRPGKIPRRPSIVPVVFSSSRQRASHQSSILSALSDGSDDDTSTAGSDDSSSEDDSESSSDSEDEAAKDSSRPRHPAQQPRRREHRAASTGGLSNSTELIVYSPEFAQNNRKKIATKSPAAPKLRRRIKMRNDNIRKHYKVSPHIIGTGVFGTVRSCHRRRRRSSHHEQQERYAVKSILKNANVKNNTLLKNEVALVQRIHHKSVVRVVDVIQDSEYIHIVMEECRGGDLFDKIVDGGIEIPERRVCEIVGSLLDAIAYLHDRDIVHRDLKAEHIMLSYDDIHKSPVKIIDFGLATTHSVNDPPMTAFAGSAFTVAPEVIQGRYGKECDMWSAGAIAYFLLTSRMPFNGPTDDIIFQKIVSGKFFYPQWAETGLSEEAKDFVDRLMVVDPRRRLTAKQALSHLWIRKYNDTRFADSMGSHDQLMLVPASEKAIFPSRQRSSPHYHQQQQQQRRKEPAMHHERAGHQHRHDTTTGMATATPAAARENIRRNPKPASDDHGGMAPCSRLQRHREPLYGRAA